MRYAFSTLCCMEKDLPQVIELACSSGMEGVEIRLGQDGTLPGGLTIADAAYVRRSFSDAGLVFTDLGLSVCPTGYEPEKIAVAKQGIDLAAAAGALAVRLFLGKRSDLAQSPENSPEGIVRTLQELSAYAREQGVEIWLETHGEYSAGRSLREIIDQTGCDNIRVIWDLIHTVEFEETVEETAALLGDLIAHVHIKDGVKSEDPAKVQYTHTDLGAGTVPLGELLTCLERIGYKGFISLEWETPWRPEIRDLYPDQHLLLAKYRHWVAENTK